MSFWELAAQADGFRIANGGDRDATFTAEDTDRIGGALLRARQH